MICTKCGANNNEEYRFCMVCGAPLGEVPPPAAVPPPPATVPPPLAAVPPSGAVPSPALQQNLNNSPSKKRVGIYIVIAVAAFLFFILVVVLGVSCVRSVKKHVSSWEKSSSSGLNEFRDSLRKTKQEFDELDREVQRVDRKFRRDLEEMDRKVKKSRPGQFERAVWDEFKSKSSSDWSREFEETKRDMRKHGFSSSAIDSIDADELGREMKKAMKELESSGF